MAINLAGLGVIYNNSSTQNQQLFQMYAVPGSLTVVYVDGVLRQPTTYTIDRSVLTLNQPLEAGRWIYVLSGQGGTFIPQSYVDNSVAPKADKNTVDLQLAAKADKVGADFTGPITVQEPTAPMNPATKQMFDTLPSIATPDYIDAAVNSKADQIWTQGQLDTKINLTSKGSPNGVPNLDNTGKVVSSQIPVDAFKGDKSLYKFGTLTVGEGQGRWFPRIPGIIRGLIAHVPSAPDGSSIQINLLKTYINELNAVVTVSLFPGTDRLIIPSGGNFIEYTFAAVPTFNRGDGIHINVDQVGSIAAGANLTVQVEFEYTP